jgi:hypothetical protein
VVPPDSSRVSRVPPYLGNKQESNPFRLQACHLLRGRFPAASAKDWFCNSLRLCTSLSLLPQPRLGNACRLHTSRFGLLPVRSPLLGESRLISFPADNEMFQFSAFTSFDDGLLIHRVAPFGNQRFMRSCTAHRCLSQLTTPFVVS